MFVLGRSSNQLIIASLHSETEPEIKHNIKVEPNEEKHCEESEQQFRATFSSAAVGIARTCGHKRTVVAESAKALRYRRLRDELQGKLSGDYTPDDLDADLEYVRRLIKIQTYSMEKRYVCKDGSRGSV